MPVTARLRGAAGCAGGRSFSPPAVLVGNASAPTLAAGGGVLVGITAHDSVTGTAFLLWVMCDEDCRPDRPAGNARPLATDQSRCVASNPPRLLTAVTVGAADLLANRDSYNVPR